MLINGLHIRIIHTTTGQISRELTLNPSPAVVSGPDVTRRLEKLAVDVLTALNERDGLRDEQRAGAIADHDHFEAQPDARGG
jgi:hypothetical protein